MKITVKKVLMPLLTSLFFVGCVSPPKERARIFFPPLPDKPRIEFLDAYQSQHNFPKTLWEMRKDAIFGKDRSFRFGRPLDVASCGDGKVYISDTLVDRVYVYDFNALKVSHLATEGSFSNPTGLATDGDCNVYVVNTKKKKVYVYDRNKEPVFSFGGAEIFEWPVGIAVDSVRGRIYVTDVRIHDVKVFDEKGKFLYSLRERAGNEVSPANAGFSFPLDVDVASDGRIVVLDAMNARVKVYSPDGEFQKVWGQRGDGGSSFGLVKGIAIDEDDNIYVTDTDSNSVKVFNLDGAPLTTFGGPYAFTKPGMAAAGGFQLISGIDADPKNGIFVADQLNKNFQVFQYLDDDYLKLHPLPVYKPEETKEGVGWDIPGEQEN